jgi:glycosyltransferase involved in cell wall biosynthesis
MKLGKHQIYIFTNNNCNYVIEGMEVIGLKSLRPYNFGQMVPKIKEISPDLVVWSISPLNVVLGYDLLFNKIKFPLIANFSFPYHKALEILRVQSKVGIRSTFRFYLNKMIPLKTFARFLNSPAFSYVISQSQRNIQILEKIGVNKGKLIHLPPGIDKSVFNPNYKEQSKEEFTFLYTGPLRKVRGIEILLKAYKTLLKLYDRVKLLILTRDSSPVEIENLEANCKRMGISRKVEIIKGWLNRDELINYLKLADVIVLPFLLVESDVPLTVVESLALGKPVITTGLDGLPELVQNRGVLVKQNDIVSLYNGMKKLIEDADYFQKLKENAKLFWEEHPSWQDVAKRFLGIIYNLIR